MSLAVHCRIIDLLDRGGVRYRLLEHAPAGRSEDVSAVRGTALADACKAIVVRAKVTKKSAERSFFLLCYPSDKRADFTKLSEFADIKLCEPADLLRLTDCDPGTVPPFSFDPALRLLMDPAVLERDVFWFNAGLLTHSIGVNADDYRRIVRPELRPLTADA